MQVLAFDSESQSRSKFVRCGNVRPILFAPFVLAPGLIFLSHDIDPNRSLLIRERLIVIRGYAEFVIAASLQDNISEGLVCQGLFRHRIRRAANATGAEEDCIRPARKVIS